MLARRATTFISSKAPLFGSWTSTASRSLDYSDTTLSLNGDRAHDICTVSITTDGNNTSILRSLKPHHEQTRLSIYANHKNIQSELIGSVRSKHSARQVKRLFNKNYNRARVLRRRAEEGQLETDSQKEEEVKPTYEPVFTPKFLSNGWSAPPGPEVDVPPYPFGVERTGNKPRGAVGFLPVYTEFKPSGPRVTTRIKRITGDMDAFLNELHAQLYRIHQQQQKREEIGKSGRFKWNDGGKLRKNQTWMEVHGVRIRAGGTVEVKGNVAREMRKWLAGLGF